MKALDDVKDILSDVLSLGDRAESLSEETVLLGGIPEFDSTVVVSVILALEEQFGIVVEDDEVSADTFETVGTLCEFLSKKVEG